MSFEVKWHDGRRSQALAGTTEDDEARRRVHVSEDDRGGQGALLWLVPYVADTLNKYKVGVDDVTAYE